MSTNERDELAEIVKREYRSAVTRKSNDCYTAPADAILAAGYRKQRTITTVEELDALRFESVITDSYGTPYVCQRHMTDGTRNDWRMSGMDTLDLSEDIVMHGPFTVRYEGNK